MSDTLWISIGIGLGSTVVLLFFIVLFVWCYRRRSRYEYTPLRGDDVALPTKWKKEKEAEEDQKRESALLNCQFFLRANVGKYSYSEYLKQIGSRLDRQWFIVRHVQMRKDMLLTVTPKSPDCKLPFDSSSNSQGLADLLQAIKHPYIWPVSDLVLQKEQQIAIVLQPFNSKGSLKDLIRNTRPQSAWSAKTTTQNKGLSLKQIRLYGRQILEALIYLKENNFPPHKHLHSGNVIYKSGVCYLSGLDNMFLGYSSSLQHLLYRKIRNNIEALDVLCFGHLLFEMTCGRELDSAHPDSDDYAQCKHPEVKEVLEFIFNKSKEYPSIGEVAGHDFFTSCNLVELKTNPPQPIKLSSGMKSIMKVIHKSKLPKISTENGEKKQVNGESKRLQREASKTNVKESNQNKSKKKGDSEGRKRKTSRTTTAPQIHAPPPPPPPPPAPLTAPPPPPAPPVSIKQPSSGPRTALLTDIRKGMKLKKTDTFDKSSPKV
ncbi:slowpoke-binding protein-like [Antedon mediterranea]|uniref:slowpoke-binding protein-like n=1 Tax=Antedon mediterranea TaxID=105859 RepID=UPI003AF9EAC5